MFNFLYIRFYELQRMEYQFMKKVLATALALLLQMCSPDVYCSKQTGSSSTKGNHHPSFLRFWNWAEENWSMQPKFVAAQKYS